MNIFGLFVNWIDGIIFLFLIIFVFLRRKNGLLLETFDLLGFLFSLLFALRFYFIVAAFLRNQFLIPQGIANAAGFLLLSVIFEPILFLLFLFFYKFLPASVVNSKINRMLWFIPAAVSGIILTAFLLTTALALPVRPDLKQAVISSALGGYVTDKTAGLEKSLSKIFGGIAQDSLNFLTVKPKGNETINLNFNTRNVSVDTVSENIMFAFVNSQRARKNLKILAPDLQLQKIARAHCQDMFVRGYFSHYSPEGKSPFDRMEDAGISYLAAGENLAYAPTVAIADKGLIESPGHRANILSGDFGRVGIGVIDGGIYGRMFCQEFTN